MERKKPNTVCCTSFWAARGEKGVVGGRSGEIYGRLMGLGEKEAQVGQIGKQSTMFRKGRLSKKRRVRKESCAF